MGMTAHILQSFLYQAIRIPMIFNQPNSLCENQRRREFVDHLDLFQTLIEHANIDPNGLQNNYAGHSFMPWLTNSSNIPNWRNAQYCEYGNLRMIRTDKYKLVRRYPNGPCELIDLSANPRESVNLFDDPAHQSIMTRLTQKLETYFETYEGSQKSGLQVRQLPRHNQTEACAMNR